MRRLERRLFRESHGARTTALAVAVCAPRRHSKAGISGAPGPPWPATPQAAEQACSAGPRRYLIIRRRAPSFVPIGIEEMTFAKGPGGSDPLSVKPTPVVILVGPNNSGKSLALREVEAFCSTPSPKTLVLSDIKLACPQSPEEALSLLAKFKTEPPPDIIIQDGQFYVEYYAPGSLDPNGTLMDIKNIAYSVRIKDMNFLTSKIIKWYTIRQGQPCLPV